MVVRTIDDGQADLLMQALADATRRDILRRAIEGAESVSTIASRYPMSFAAVQKHVAVLERAGLVSKQRRGREQLVRTQIATVRSAAGILDEFEELWRTRIAQIDELLAEPDESADADGHP